METWEDKLIKMMPKENLLRAIASIYCPNDIGLKNHEDYCSNGVRICEVCWEEAAKEIKEG